LVGVGLSGSCTVEIRCQFIFLGWNNELTPNFPAVSVHFFGLE
jgi:hypothetical protein